MSSDTPAGGATLTREMIERLVSRSIDDFDVYRRALTHRSLLRGDAGGARESNERLEFLGDALLDFIVGEMLYDRFPDRDEGFLTRMRAKLVRRDALAQYARHIQLGDYVLMSDNAARGQGRDNPSILADAFEALAAALYLDQGYPAARAFVQNEALESVDFKQVARQEENYKSLLLERMQAEGRPQPTYRVIHEEGPSHDKTFTVEALVDDVPHGRGTAGSKKQAEQHAARAALEKIQDAGVEG